MKEATLQKKIFTMTFIKINRKISVDRVTFMNSNTAVLIIHKIILFSSPLPGAPNKEANKNQPKYSQLMSPRALLKL